MVLNKETRQIKFSIQKPKKSPIKRSGQPACVRCRRRHAKCDGNGGPCSQCAAARKKCEYQQAERKVLLKESVVAEMRDHAAQLAAENARLRALLDDAAPSKGHTLVDTELHSSLLQDNPAAITSMTVVVSKIGHICNVAVGTAAAQVFLPFYNDALAAIDTFEAYTAGYYFLNGGVLKQKLYELYDADEIDSLPSHASALALCQLELVLALSELFQRPGPCATPIRLSGLLLASGVVHNVASIDGLETLLLYSYFLLQTRGLDAASYTLQAARLALTRQYHCDAEQDHSAATEHRRRLLWTIYVQERVIAAAQGSPVLLHDHILRCELPGTARFEHQHPFVFPDPEPQLELVAVTKLNCMVLRKLHPAPANCIATVREMVVGLLRWKRAVHESVDCDYSLKEVHNSRATANIMLEYFQGLNLAVRPLLLEHSVAQRGRGFMSLQDCPSTELSLLNASFQASMNTVRCLWSLWETNQFVQGGRSDLEYLYSAVATLVLFNVTFGVHETTRFHIDHALAVMHSLAQCDGARLGRLFLAQTLALLEALDGIEQPLLARYRTDDPATTHQGFAANVSVDEMLSALLVT
ncbi:uncharacterized protein OGAPODRAFT_7173 [Ogataea polymorpha]|uniref:uncharacterized protein n=1 Tax=Ogataea polymorpha TaxID=460523 RepID=UPI0007F3952F|nr:uncharacterized protein OGAPODRAFT_7173 [Ogataea polymorpha]KAG7935729.1 hypothetical protein KL934_002288 [Ogataea polymorpha]OBA17691.1 hypothetical protein OGAPODRAFT_7173 [Ogataea polymorpha]